MNEEIIKILKIHLSEYEIDWKDLNSLVFELEKISRKATAEEICGLLDAQIVKPEYHNALVGKVNELRK